MRFEREANSVNLHLSLNTYFPHRLWRFRRNDDLICHTPSDTGFNCVHQITTNTLFEDDLRRRRHS